jgi:hypothetical protein
MKDNSDATFQGGCLCGAYKFQVKNLEAGWQPRKCNCAICRKKGALWVAPPSQDDFIILKDDGNLKSYTFGPKCWSHEVTHSLSHADEESGYVNLDCSSVRRAV